MKRISKLGSSGLLASALIPAACGVSLATAALVGACGQQKAPDDGKEQETKTVLVAGPKVTVTVPVKVYVTAEPAADGGNASNNPSATPAPTPIPKFFVASNSFRYVSAYDSSGTLVKSFDLATVISSPVTAMAFLNKNTLLFFVDPGASGEVIAKLDVDSGVVMPSFIVDPAFSNSVVQQIAAVGPNQFYLARQGGGIERMHVDLPTSIVTRFTGTWPLANTANCPATTYQLGVPFLYSGTRGIAMFSSGVNTRVNMWTALETSPACGTTTSTNYGAGGVYPAAAGYTPVGAYYDAAASKWYVRYYHATTPRIVRYDFNGQALTNGIDIVTNPGLLTTNLNSRELTPLDATRMLVPEWSSNSIHIFNVNGNYEGVFARNSFTTGVNAIAVRPEP